MEHGSIGEFDHTQESYVERVSLYFIANEITDEGKRRATLLTVCGAKTYHVIRDLAAPKSPAEVAYDDIVSLVKQHYNPKPVVTVQRFKFNSRSRQKDESVATFVAELRHLAIHCAFGEALNDMLRDRLICRINNKRIQCRLLSEKEVDFKKVLGIAQAMESSDKDSQHLQVTAADTAEVHRVRSTGKPSDKADKGGRSCGRCNSSHLSKDCCFKDFDCHNCGKKGHIARACRSKKTKGKAAPKQRPGTKTANAHNVEEQEESPEDVYTMFKLKQRRDNPMTVMVTVNSKPIKMEIDMGAVVSIISEKTYQETWAKGEAPAIQPAKIRLRTYTGEEVKVAGKLQVLAKQGSEQAKLPLIVAKGEGPNLLGRDWLAQLKLDWKEAFMVGPSKSDRLEDLLETHKAVFQEGLGTIGGTTAKIHVNPEVTPKFCKPRPVPFPLRKKVESELESWKRRASSSGSNSLSGQPPSFRS